MSWLVIEQFLSGEFVHYRKSEEEAKELAESGEKAGATCTVVSFAHALAASEMVAALKFIVQGRDTDGTVLERDYVAARAALEKAGER